MSYHFKSINIISVILSSLILLTSVSTITANCLPEKTPAYPVKLKCNYRENPIGLEDLSPDFSWQTLASENNWLQSAYQVIVSTNLELLNEKNCDIWNSGKITGGESVCIPYNGLSLESRHRYYWKVRVWDKDGNPSSWSEPAFWEMGLLNPDEWSAKWISFIDEKSKHDRDNIQWIWLADQDATDVPQSTVAIFQQKVNIDEMPAIASMQTVARGNYRLFVNGTLVDSKDKSWQVFERQDILGYIRPGENTIEVEVSSTPGASFDQATGKALRGNYAAFAALLKIEEKDGSIRKYPTSVENWESRNQTSAEYNRSVVVGELNNPKFGLDPGPLSVPASVFRKGFKLKKAIKSARLYVSALGSYKMYINGDKVGRYVLTPEFTNYQSRITYQVYNITEMLEKGNNVVGSLLGDGWYGSPLGWNGEYDIFGNTPNMLLAEVYIEYNDGTTEKILTDDSWKASRSPILKSEVYSGEFYDARLELDGWNTKGFNDKEWDVARIMGNNYKVLSPQVTTPVMVTQVVKPVKIHKSGEQKWIVDMGQNLVGWVRLKVQGEAGTVIKMRFAEILGSEDSLYVDNLRNATTTDCYVLNGKGEEVFTPNFTFHGFRYVEVTGYPGELGNDAIVAEVISSVENPTGYIHTSDSLVNKMYSLGIWGQRSNFISVPTDCPQRDERLGYTGDGQVFWRTGTYNFDIAAFTHKWMRDIKDEQTPDGSFPNTAPTVPKSNRKNGAPGWEDAGVIVPWSSWMQYGDKGIIEENWSIMVRYMEFLEKRSQGYIRPGYFLGDHLATDFSTPSTLISTGLWALTADMMSQMATAIGKTVEAEKYVQLKKKIQVAFQKEFISTEGKIGSGSQASYAIALHAGLVPDSLLKVVTDNFVKAIEDRDWHVSTGFIGTPYLLFALSENGRDDIAYRLLLNETYPSWGYMVKSGATTWWERWNSDSGDPSMNSFNHYAFGSVLEWVYRRMAGINTNPDSPGFKKIIISPIFDRSGKINHIKGEYLSVYGKIESEWTINNNLATLKVTVPANTTARIILPDKAVFKTVPGNDDHTSVEVGSGVHEFTIDLL